MVNTNQRKVNVVTSARPTLINITLLHFLYLISAHLPASHVFTFHPNYFLIQALIQKPTFTMPVHEIKR